MSSLDDLSGIYDDFGEEHKDEKTKDFMNVFFEKH